MSGLQLLNPLALFALAALAVPLLIHLFSRSRGRQVMVGNIALYRQGQRQRVLEPRVAQWLLLVLRMLLLIVAALMLAGLATPAGERLKGATAYVTPEWLAAPEQTLAALEPYDQVIVLAPGYPNLAESKTLDRIPATDAWSLLAERLATAVHDGEVHIYAVAAARQFPGEAPALPGALHWHFDERPEALAELPLPELLVYLVNAPTRSDDADIVATALELAAAHRRVTISVRRAVVGTQDALFDTAESDATDVRRVLIWLGNETAAPELAGKDMRVDRLLEDYRSGRGSAERVQLPGGLPLRFSARPAANPSPAEQATDVRWRTESGTPLLVSSRDGGTQRLRFLDQLTSEPGGLLANAAFPDVLLQLLLGDSSWASATDTAAANPARAVARATTADSRPVRGLEAWLAFLLAALFALERWLSERPDREHAE